MTIVLGSSWGQHAVKVSEDGLPDMRDVLRMIAGGHPIAIEVMRDDVTAMWLTPAAILTVTKDD